MRAPELLEEYILRRFAPVLTVLLNPVTVFTGSTAEWRGLSVSSVGNALCLREDCNAFPGNCRGVIASEDSSDVYITDDVEPRDSGGKKAPDPFGETGSSKKELDVDPYDVCL